MGWPVVFLASDTNCPLHPEKGRGQVVVPSLARVEAIGCAPGAMTSRGVADEAPGHLVGTQRSSGAELTCRASTRTDLLIRHVYNSPIHQNEQLKRKRTALQMQTTKQRIDGATIASQIPCHERFNSSQISAVSAVPPTAKASHWSFRLRTMLDVLLTQ